MKRFKISALLFSISLVSIGCGQKVHFNSAEAGSIAKSEVPDSPTAVPVEPTPPPVLPPPVVVVPPPIEPCIPGSILINKPVKFIIVVDQSGSNETGPSLGMGGTDPGKKMRYKAMDSFLKEHGKKNNIEWSVISFSGSMAKALTRKGRDFTTPVFTDELGMYAALAEFENSSDGGVTPYLPALDMVHDLIRDDIKSSHNGAHYRIAFLSDGYPTDHANSRTMATELAKRMEKLMSISPNEIQLSTVYYGSPNKNAVERLQRMANDGNGIFVNATNAKTISLGEAIRIPIRTCE